MHRSSRSFATFLIFFFSCFGAVFCAVAARNSAEAPAETPAEAPPADSSADSPPPVTAVTDTPIATARDAIERGLAFLNKDAYRWKNARGCAACHHAALPLWSFNEARARGYSVDEAPWKELAEWTVSASASNVVVPQAPPRDVINLGATYTLLSLETAPVPAPDDPLLADRRFLLRHVAIEQEADGSWGLPLDERAPLGGPVEDIALLSRIALLQSGDDSTTTTVAVAKAAEWLDAHRDKPTRQGRNLRLLMALHERRPAEELASLVEPAVAEIRAEQNADGGWSQTPEMPSDAYATGQSLYVLARAGVAPEAPEMTRGVDFLTRSENEDGSWPMTSRVNSKDTTPIVSVGAAWAVLGLVRGAPPPRRTPGS